MGAGWLPEHKFRNSKEEEGERAIGITQEEAKDVRRATIECGRMDVHVQLPTASPKQVGWLKGERESRYSF